MAVAAADEPCWKAVSIEQICFSAMRLKEQGAVEGTLCGVVLKDNNRKTTLGEPGPQVWGRETNLLVRESLEGTASSFGRNQVAGSWQRTGGKRQV